MKETVCPGFQTLITFSCEQHGNQLISGTDAAVSSSVAWVTASLTQSDGGGEHKERGNHSSIISH